MSTVDGASGHSGLLWFKSSYSGDDGGNCVEVATVDAAVLVRDSKDGEGVPLAFPAEAWVGFVALAGQL